MSDSNIVMRSSAVIRKAITEITGIIETTGEIIVIPTIINRTFQIAKSKV